MNALQVWDSLDLSWADKIAYLTYELGKLPQTEIPLKHIFEPGRYIREVRVPAGELVIGRGHRKGHYMELVSGRALHITPDCKRELSAPYAITTKPGFHMVAFTLEDVVCRTYHSNPTESRDTEALEAEAFEPLESLTQLGAAVTERIAYYQMLSEHKVDEEQLRPLIENTLDQIPFNVPVCVEVRSSPIHGQGLFAMTSFQQGDFVAPARVSAMRTPAGRYTNHARVPNVSVVKLKNGDLIFVASRPIVKDEEITVSYKQSIEAAA